MPWTRLRLGPRLGVTHGVFVVVSVVLLAVMLQGLLRMLGVMSGIANERLATVDAEEELYRSAWSIEVGLRHTRSRCAEGESADDARARIKKAAATFREVSARQTDVPPRLREAVDRYARLADDAVGADTCRFLAEPSTEARRLALDEEMTDTWIERLQELNTDIAAKETSARLIGNRTALGGITVALLGAIAAVFVARVTARSVTRPIARLAVDATRLGDGDFTPLAEIDGPPEIEPFVTISSARGRSYWASIA